MVTREEFLEERKTGIGGSDVAKILGISHYGSPLSLWAEKTGKVDPQEAGEPAKWGNLIEPLIIEQITEQLQVKTVASPDMFRHPDYPFMLAHVDGLIMSPGDEPEGILEAKTVGLRLFRDWDEGIPPYYVTQVQHYMCVTGLPYAEVGVLICGQELSIFHVDANREYQELLIEEEQKFWNCVETNVPPEADGSDATSEALKRLYDRPTPTVIELDKEWLDKLDEYKKLREEEKQIHTQAEEISNQLRLVQGENSRATINGEVVSMLSIGNRTTLDRKKLEVENPELAEQIKSYDKHSTYPIFKIVAGKT